MVYCILHVALVMDYLNWDLLFNERMSVKIRVDFSYGSKQATLDPANKIFTCKEGISRCLPLCTHPFICQSAWKLNMKE